MINWEEKECTLLALCLLFPQFDPLYLPATPESVAAAGAAAGVWAGGWFARLCLLGKIGVYTGLLLITVLICSNPGILPRRPKGNSSVEELMDVRLLQIGWSLFACMIVCVPCRLFFHFLLLVLRLRRFHSSVPDAFAFLRLTIFLNALAFSFTLPYFLKWCGAAVQCCPWCIGIAEPRLTCLQIFLVLWLCHSCV